MAVDRYEINSLLFVKVFRRTDGGKTNCPFGMKVNIDINRRSNYRQQPT